MIIIVKENVNRNLEFRQPIFWQKHKKPSTSVDNLNKYLNLKIQYIDQTCQEEFFNDLRVIEGCCLIQSIKIKSYFIVLLRDTNIIN